MNAGSVARKEFLNHISITILVKGGKKLAPLHYLRQLLPGSAVPPDAPAVEAPEQEAEDEVLEPQTWLP